MAFNTRSGARRVATQALYQWQLTGQTASEIIRQLVAEPPPMRYDHALFVTLLRGVVDNVERLDALLAPFLDRPIREVDPVERAILRLAAFELENSPEVPWRVVLNEAIDLARLFGAEQSHRYVNGVLDSLARVLRPVEAGSA